MIMILVVFNCQLSINLLACFGLSTCKPHQTTRARLARAQTRLTMMEKYDCNASAAHQQEASATNCGCDDSWKSQMTDWLAQWLAIAHLLPRCLGA
jgi:hypothetical protein